MKILNIIICYFTITIIAFLVVIVWTLSLPIIAQIVFTIVGIIDDITIMVKTMIEINKEK